MANGAIFVGFGVPARARERQAVGGFFLLRGDTERLDRLRREGDFRRLSARAGLVVDGFGVVGAHAGDALGEQLAIYGGQVEEQLASG